LREFEESNGEREGTRQQHEKKNGEREQKWDGKTERKKEKDKSSGIGSISAIVAIGRDGLLDGLSELFEWAQKIPALWSAVFFRSNAVVSPSKQPRWSNSPISCARSSVPSWIPFLAGPIRSFALMRCIKSCKTLYSIFEWLCLQLLPFICKPSIGKHEKKKWSIICHVLSTIFAW
jgi:hypothetical protein